MPMARHSLKIPFTLVLLATLAAANAVAQSATSPSSADPAASAEWHQFRGPSRSGHGSDVNLARAWPDTGPPVVWKRPLGEGFASLSISQGRLFTSFSDGDKEFVVALDVETGEELWRQALGPAFEEFFGNGPRSTPTVDGPNVYALGSRGHLLALQAEDGSILWQVDLHGEHPITQPQTLTPVGATPPGPQLPVYGYAGSPLVVDDLLLVETGARGGLSFIAFDKHDGRVRWSALDTEIGYASPTLFDIHGQRQIIVLPGDEIVALTPQGEELWRYPWAWTTSQPLFLPPDRIFVSAENDAGALMLRIAADARGAENGGVSEVWRSKRLKNAWNSSVQAGDHIYGFDNATLRCLRADDGSLQWAQRGLGKGNLIYADGLLIVLTDKGKVVIGDAEPEGFFETGSLQALSGRCWTPPALSGGILFARNHQEIVALDLRPQGDESESTPQNGAPGDGDNASHQETQR